MDPNHLRVADGRRHDSQDPTRATKLDVEVFPRLEHPGWWLGPFGASGVEPARATRAVLIWPEAPQGGFLPSAVEPFRDSLRAAGLSLPVTYAPPADLRRELAAADLGAVCAGTWEPVDAHDHWVVWMEDPLQVLGLLSVLTAARVPIRAADRTSDHPRVIVTGPATRATHLLRAFADAVVADPQEVVAWLAEAVAAVDPPDFPAPWTGSRPVDAAEVPPLDAPAIPTEPRRKPQDQPLPPVTSRDLRAPLEETWTALNGAPHTRLRVWAGSERLRRELDLPSGAELSAILRRVFEHPAAQLELLMAVNLPGERPADREAVAAFLGQVVDLAPRGAKQVALHLHAHVPGPDDPLAPPAALGDRIEEVLTAVGRPKLRRRTSDPVWTVMSGALAKADVEWTPVVEAMWRAGADRAESTLARSGDLWHKALQAGKILDLLHRSEPAAAPVATEPAASADAREPDPVADTGLALDAVADDPSSSGPRREPIPDVPPRPGDADGTHRRWLRWSDLARHQFEYRLEYGKRGRLRLLGHREIVDIFLRAFHDADLPLATSGVVQPRPKVSFGPPLPVGVEGLREYVDVGLTRKIADLPSRLLPHLPQGLQILRARFVPLLPGRSSLGHVAEAEYRLTIPPSAWRGDPLGPADLERGLAELRTAASGDDPDPVAATLGQIVRFEASTGADGSLEVTFRLDLRPDGPKCKPLDLLATLLADRIADVRTLPILRTRLLTRGLAPGRPLVSPMEQIEDAERQLRARAKWCA